MYFEFKFFFLFIVFLSVLILFIYTKREVNLNSLKCLTFFFMFHEISLTFLTLFSSSSIPSGIFWYDTLKPSCFISGHSGDLIDFQLTFVCWMSRDLVVVVHACYASMILTNLRFVEDVDVW